MRERYKRLIVLTSYLLDHPRIQLSLTELSGILQVAKSTLSEDLMFVKGILESSGRGRVMTQVGVQGGVIYLPNLDRARARNSLQQWAERLMEPERLTADGFLYMTDLLFDPAMVDPLGELLAAPFNKLHVDSVATVETKGIPLAMACARALGTEVVLIRRDSRLSEGSALSINYLSGSSRRIQSMSLSRRALKPGSSVLFVDDFMKAGGTARAASDLLGEFGATVVGVGVLVATREPANKLVDKFWSLLEWQENAPSRVVPSEWANALCEMREEH
ncbi:pur operon repressor [Sulfobacillus thermosulfidooxidans]|uniref:Purine operon repressor, PurR n=1 Tax=Sulfobacillus thermosulfidooxidans (strain DSM 9293 / VKM B-1269 / AT-1) TaxID=929705 RepID=A0A1W1WBV1_SULTA|nr:pur operon repressor [Sulfobacillus thermosulfidooxidans]OLZ11986.1 pur operon repressor [Sulfobacillus thermosulfidooxidans]OLZ17669.1 pur operon repressor [Sulfobacillus thermosulfidooxidans]OLZ22450.1 pur operon repressor [Sulfobacillus thermosulfidooxidans]SMC03223.1 purine operon repressor, PurR [Sulfobacillus thermosulfidooxidans DSM 9293]